MTSSLAFQTALRDFGNGEEFEVTGDLFDVTWSCLGWSFGCLEDVHQAERATSLSAI